MEKEFIPYEQALALKELGFDEQCLALYDLDGKITIQYVNWENAINRKNNYLISAPLYQQVFRWFRDKYDYYAFLQPTSDLISENYCFKILDQYSGKFYSKSYDKYEEAELECLKELIEIVKN